MKKILLMLAVLVLTAVTASAETLHDYEIKTGHFSRLKVVNSVNVVYVASSDSAGRACFRAPKSQADLFIVSNKDGQLKVETLPMEPGMKNLPTLYVYSEFLSDVQNDSDSTLTVRRLAPCPKFKAVQIGNGRLVVDNIHATDVEGKLTTGNGAIVLNGQCSSAKFVMVGTGLIQADDLTADRVNCTILGGGTIGCWPRFNLNVKGIGSTKIYYKGTPEIKKKGGGKLFQLKTYEDDDSYAEGK